MLQGLFVSWSLLYCLALKTVSLQVYPFPSGPNPELPKLSHLLYLLIEDRGNVVISVYKKGNEKTC